MSPGNRINTIPDLLHWRVMRTPSSIALSEKCGSPEWAGMTWQRFDRAVADLAQRLLSVGIGRGDQVAILMANAVQWEIIQHAVLRLGGVIIGLDLSDPAERVDDLLSQCTLRALFVDCAARLDRIPRRHLEAIDFIFNQRRERLSAQTPPVQSIDEIPPPAHFLAATPPEAASVATIIFTSGTTGRPKALCYTHGQLLLAVRAITPLFSDLPEQANTACWLPLANPFQRIINLCAIAANWHCFIVAEPARIMDEVREIDPHFLAGVPRFYEKLMQSIKEGIRRKASWQRALSNWAIGVGRSVSKQKEAGGTITRRLKWLHRLADALVLRKVRRIMGRHLKYFISGSAPLSEELINEYLAFGWSIFEAYGISENIAPMAMNSPKAHRSGSVGRPLAENTITIAADGEILVKGAGLAANLSCGEDGGFLRTGDLGRIDTDGYVYLLGRKNDTFKLSTGRKIIPQMIEQPLGLLDGVEHCIAVGHNQKRVIALLNVDAERWRHFTDRNGGEERAHCAMKRKAQQACRHLPRYCQPAEILIVSDPFTPATGELTPNQKLRRKAVITKYAHTIERCYHQIETERN